MIRGFFKMLNQYAVDHPTFPVNRRHFHLIVITGEELKCFQSVAARFNFFAMDRPDLLYSVKELMQQMASPRAGDLIALKWVARHTTKYPRMACRYLWTPLNSNIEVNGDANFAECISTRKSTVGGVALWSGQSAKAAVDKEWEKLEKIPAWQLRNVRNKKEVIDEARTRRALKFILPH